MTHVTACQGNDSSECLSLQIMTHATACHDNDSRDYLPWQIMTHMTVMSMTHATACHESDSRQIMTHAAACHDNDTWLLVMTSWLAWLLLTTMAHVNVVNSDIKTIALRLLTLTDRVRWHWRPSACCRFSLALSVCVQKWRLDIRAIRGLRSKFWLINCDRITNSEDKVWHTVLTFTCR